MEGGGGGKGWESVPLHAVFFERLEVFPNQAVLLGIFYIMLAVLTTASPPPPRTASPLFRSQIVFEVKPWDTETDLKELFKKICEV